MSRSGLHTARLFIIVSAASLVLGGLVLMQVVADALRSAGVDEQAAELVRRNVLVALLTLAVILLGVAIVAGRAYARSLGSLRRVVLARARGETAEAPTFAVTELDGLASAIDRLSARVSSREADAAREGADVGALLDSISEGILQLDAGGRVIRANPAARGLLGLTARATGQPLSTHIRHTDLRRMLADAMRGRTIPAAEIALDERRIIVSARPLPSATGGSPGTVIGFVDLTEVRRLESVRRDFVANVSHELKTPLTSIRGYIETVLTDPDLPAETQRQFLEVAHKNADRLHHIVDDLLDLSRLESGGWRPEMRNVNATEVIADVWSTCAPRADQKRVAFKQPDQPAAVRADPGALRQVLTNLLENALRYTPDGGCIQVSAQPAAPGYIAIEVRDSGTGIPSDALPRIFERFYRVDPARSRADGGTGLGLAIVKHLVESMGGEVSAASELGKGTRIRFTVPAAA